MCNSDVGSHPPDDRSYRSKISDRADLVVDGHHADERHLPGRLDQCRGELVEIDGARRVDSDDAAVPGFDRVQHGVVLGSRTQRNATTTIQRAEDRGVVGFGAAACEDHLAWLTPEYVGHVVASLVDGLADVSGKSMGAGRVGELLGEKRQHCLDRVGAHRRRRRMVEVGVAVVHGVKATPAHWPQTAVVVEDDVMDGYTESTYGDAFADVYDEWYHDLSDVAATVDLIHELASAFARLPVLELGVGTGRLAIPLAARGIDVVGLDASTAMLAKLAENDSARISGRAAGRHGRRPAAGTVRGWCSWPTTRSSACSARIASRPVSHQLLDGWHPAAAS